MGMHKVNIKLLIGIFCFFSGMILTASVSQAASTENSLLYGGSEVANYFISDSATGTSAGVFTVTPSAGTGGSINPNTPQTVSSGSVITFTVTPNAGYTASVGGTCGGNLSGNTYTTSAITADCTVVASFTQNAEISKCTAKLESRGGNMFLMVPIVAINGSNGTVYYYTELLYDPADSKSIFKLTANAGVITDVSPYVNCQQAILSPFGNDLIFHLAKMDYSGTSMWVNLKYLPSSDGSLRFEITNYGLN